MPGSDIFLVKFNCSKIIWTLSSYESDHKSSVASDAGIHSRKWKKSGELLLYGSDDSIDSKAMITVYPNPVSGNVFIKISNQTLSSSDIYVYNVVGKQQLIPAFRTSDSIVELGMSALNAGLYFIKVNIGDRFEILRIIKE